MRTPKLLKIYFYLNRAEEGKHTPTDEDLKEAFKYPPLTGEFSEVPADRSDIRDYDGMTTNKQFWWTKVHAVYEGGHTLDVWTDLNSCQDKCWMGFSDYGDLAGMLGDYRYELPKVADD
jgi:hypothetical protein